MMVAIACALMLGQSAPTPARDSWFGADKLKHFLLSAFVQSASYSVARLAGSSGRDAQAAGAVATMTVGLWKEFHDRAQQKPFSPRDLAWDAAGALTAAALLNGAR